MNNKVKVGLFSGLVAMGLVNLVIPSQVYSLPDVPSVSLKQDNVKSRTPIRDLDQSREITLEGVVTSVVGNEFILDDGTGQVIVDTAPRWWVQLNFAVGEQLVVVGEYDDEDFDAFRIARADGTVITLREGPGRPPWARNRRGE